VSAMLNSSAVALRRRQLNDSRQLSALLWIAWSTLSLWQHRSRSIVFRVLDHGLVLDRTSGPPALGTALGRVVTLRPPRPYTAEHRQAAATRHSPPPENRISR